MQDKRFSIFMVYSTRTHCSDFVRLYEIETFRYCVQLSKRIVEFVFFLSPLLTSSVAVAVLSKCYRSTTTRAATNRLHGICLFHVTTVIQNVQRTRTEFIATDFHCHNLCSSSQTKIQLAKK